LKTPRKSVLTFVIHSTVPIIQGFPGVDQIKLEASDLCTVKLDPDLGVEYETVEDVSLEDAANVYFRNAMRICVLIYILQWINLPILKRVQIIDSDIYMRQR
jgi:hypothetical protein